MKPRLIEMLSLVDARPVAFLTRCRECTLSAAFAASDFRRSHMLTSSSAFATLYPGNKARAVTGKARLSIDVE
jgi:hypothetical protein